MGRHGIGFFLFAAKEKLKKCFKHRISRESKWANSGEGYRAVSSGVSALIISGTREISGSADGGAEAAPVVQSERARMLWASKTEI
ncbi:MAG: hypothetical protein EB125_02930 [Betaproteobacteria bacterium]|nr:hypothetical protein [Betaproteobacteria bacterium]